MNSQDSMEQYLATLNEPQRQAVEHVEGPLMVIAGAGSGKTRVLTFRIARLMELGVEPFQILALTFTNKAAGEMRERIERIVGTEARSLWMGTFHSVFAKILRIEGQRLGYTRDFTIYDTDDSRSLIKSIVRELKLDDKLYRPAYVHGRISLLKNSLISYREYLSNPIFLAEDEAAERPHIGTIYKMYQERCFKANAMDFDDLLFNTNVLFRDHLDVLNKYQHRFQFIMVDEFQDTNLAQYWIIRKLANVHRNIGVVGDDAQSIYAFRGADIRNILNFQKDYPEAVVVRLEQNYRSTQVIVDAANEVIAHNLNQLPKKVWTSNPKGELIKVIEAWSDNEEARLVVDDLQEQKLKKQLPNGEIAILYRTNAQSRAFEEALRRAGVKYRIIGGISFYQRKEIKDILAYLRLTLNPNDEEAFKRIVNFPKRGLGNVTIDKVLVAARTEGLGLWGALKQANRYLKGNTLSAIEEFTLMIEAFRLMIQERDAYEVATEVVRRSGLLKEYYEDKSVEGIVRYENIQEFLNGVQAFVQDPNREDKSLSAFLQEVALLTSVDEAEDDEEAVSLMTVHGAKGLEFRQVYVVGMEEELFPSYISSGTAEELEEERRLFYVAMTRAKERLTLSFAKKRYIYGNLKDRTPSRFLQEIPPAYLDWRGSMASSRPNGDDTKAHLASAIRQYKQNQMPPKATSYRPPADFQPSDIGLVVEGARVEHKKFGFGRVLTVEGSGDGKKATIQFDEVGQKTLLLKFAKLRVHPND
ncbi:ATP-dependent helicase [Thermonema rossianum]|uniref:ATP-dependent helicase n=1 Tax=Thermonema rossianum TaxID=55505 RepID=UPI000A842CA1|nr:UvrD-helicase domain-containing protein [Thermonema rossianum]